MNKLALVPAVMLCGIVLAQQYPFLPVPGGPKTVKNLFEDSQGRLWLGGPEAACFDGTRFFFLRDYGMPASGAGEVVDFAEDVSGGIWIGAESGVYRFANGRVEVVAKGVAMSVIPVTPDLVVAAMAPPGQAQLSNLSLFRIDHLNGKWNAERVMNLESPSRVTLDLSGKLLYMEPGKSWNEVKLDDVVRWRRGAGPVPITRHHAGRFPSNGSMKVLRDHRGCVWFGSDSGVGFQCGDTFGMAPFEGAHPHSTMHESADGSMVLWGDGMVSIGRPGAFRTATRANGLPGLADAIKARDGTVWLATPQGLYRFGSPFSIEFWTIRDGVRDVPWAIGQSGNEMYAGLDNGNIVRLTNDRSRWDQVASAGNRVAVGALEGDGHGNLLVGLRDGGVIMLAPIGAILARTAPNSPRVGMRLARTSNGEVWAGGTHLGRVTRAGSLLRWDEHALNVQPAKNVLGIAHEDRTRRLWACYSGGLVMRDDATATWKEFGAADGLRGNGCWSVAPLANGDVWYANFQLPALTLLRLGSDGRMSAQHFERILDPRTVALLTDRRGWLWRAGELGPFIADATLAEAGKWLQLDRSDGFPASGMNSGSAWADNDGSMWWGADNDLAHYTPPADLVAPQFSPNVFVSAFSWDGQAPKLAGALGALPYGIPVVAHIGSLQFDRRNAMQVRYRLLPKQSEWRETTAFDLAMGPLTSGAHRLEVQGRVFTGPWSPTRTYGFTVPVPVWRSWPLLALYALTGAMMTFGAYALYRRRKAEEEELLPNLAAWRLGALLPEVSDLTGTALDNRFDVGELMARGGFANVMDGYDREQKQRCAIKVFRGEIKDKEWIQRGFEQEVAALQRVEHPNVVSIYAQGNAPSGAPYLVMEFVEGRTLREVLEEGALPAPRAARLLRQLAGALDAIHAQDIFHRDVKPENIIVRNERASDEEAVLIDFSIAIVKDASETMYGLSRAAGTFDYMAPEQAVGCAEPASDIYSLAKVAIEMVTGKRLAMLLPSAGLDLPERVRELLKSSGLADEASDLWASALAFDPAQRPKRAGAFAQTLASELELAGGLLGKRFGA